MTLSRMVVVLLAAALVMLSVVALRAEATGLRHRAALVQRECAALREALAERELELAGMRDPMRMRERLRESLFRDEPNQPPRRGR